MNRYESEIMIFNENRIEKYKINASDYLNVFLEKIKHKYSVVHEEEYDSGFLPSGNCKMKITDSDLVEKYDEIKPLTNIIKQNSYIYSDDIRYQEYAGKALAFIYKDLYKILIQKFDKEQITKLDTWIDNEKDIIESTKKEIISDYLKNIEFILTSIISSDEFLKEIIGTNIDTTNIIDINENKKSNTKQLLKKRLYNN